MLLQKLNPVIIVKFHTYEVIQIVAYNIAPPGVKQ
jgi:hypothetical protein